MEAATKNNTSVFFKATDLRNNDEITYSVSPASPAGGLILFAPDFVKKSLRNATMRRFFALSGTNLPTAGRNN